MQLSRGSLSSKIKGSDFPTAPQVALLITQDQAQISFEAENCPLNHPLPHSHLSQHQREKEMIYLGTYSTVLGAELGNITWIILASGLKREMQNCNASMMVKSIKRWWGFLPIGWASTSCSLALSAGQSLVYLKLRLSELLSHDWLQHH